MRRITIRGLAAGAALLVTIAPAFAQRPPLSALVRPKPVPDSSATHVPATPETLNVTPEVFQRLNIPKGATVTNRAARFSEGYSQYVEPLAIPGPVRGTVPLAPGAVIFDAAVRVDERRWRTPVSIPIGAPFNYILPAGSVFAGVLDEDGNARPCLAPKPYEPFDPPKDDDGETYMGACLGGADGGGRYTSAHFRARNPDVPKPIAVAITPVQLDPIAAGISHPHFGVVLAVRRLRIVDVGADSVTIALEMAVTKQLEDKGPRDPFGLETFRPVSSHPLPLADGARITVSGVTLTVRRAGSGWTVEASGGFDRWASTSADGVAVRLGEVSYGPRAR